MLNIIITKKFPSVIPAITGGDHNFSLTAWIECGTNLTQLRAVRGENTSSELLGWFLGSWTNFCGEKVPYIGDLGTDVPLGNVEGEWRAAQLFWKAYIWRQTLKLAGRLVYNPNKPSWRKVRSTPSPCNCKWPKWHQLIGERWTVTQHHPPGNV